MTDVATLWSWLDEVPDPEIPVLSVTDLGIVRDVRTRRDDRGEVVEVALTPTYSGCPATQVIADDVTRALRDHGIERVQIDVRLAPAWTTDWISDRGRKRLNEYGIVPPQGKASPLAPLAFGVTVSEIVRCPQCSSGNTEETSHFGSTPCKALYRCRACGEPFDYFKPH